VKLEDLKSELKTDLYIDQQHLADAAANNSLLHQKYSAMTVDLRMQYKRELIEFYRVKKTAYRYYQGYEMTCPPETLDARGVKVHIEGDDKVLEIQKRLFVLEEKIKFLEDACQSIVARGFNIRNIIEIKKFQAGL